MLIAGFPAGSFQTNCYVVAPAAGEECVIVDPGQDAVDGVEELLREHRLKPGAVLLTHGHLVGHPAAGLSPSSSAMFGGITLSEPDDVRELSDGAVLPLAGLELVVD